MSEEPDKPRQSPLNHLFWLASLALMGVAMALPCLTMVTERTGEFKQLMYGWEVALMGWLGLFIGQLAWYANLLWPIAILAVILRWPKTALICTFLAGLLAVQTFLLFAMRIPADESGMNYMKLTRIGPAFYVWVTSLALPGVWAVMRMCRLA